MNKDELQKQIAVLEILNEEMPFKYPKGSAICIVPTHGMDNDEKGKYNLLPGRYHCCWYDKVGIGLPLKNIVSRPQEWQNLSEVEAKKIAAMFDKPIIIKID